MFKYTIKENFLYYIRVIYTFIQFGLEFLHLKHPLINKYINIDSLSDEMFNSNLSSTLIESRFNVFIIHLRCGQRYGNNKPYFYHLNMVASKSVNNYLNCYNHFNYDHFINIYNAALGHDLIEDCRLTYNDVVKMYNVDVADIIFNCTESAGKNREERHDDAYYKRVTSNIDSIYVKLNDIYSNITEGKQTKSSMFYKYRHEWYKKVKNKLYHKNLEYMHMIIESKFN